MNDRLLTTREVAAHLSLSPESVLRRWRRGEIPGGIRLATNVLRFRESAIDQWLTDLEAPVASAGRRVTFWGRVNRGTLLDGFVCCASRGRSPLSPCLGIGAGGSCAS
jgi:predicted DNA-binding transcriptional regulator AlpA